MYQSVFTDELFMDAGLAMPVIKGWGSHYVDFRGMINGKGIEDQTEGELKAIKGQMDSLGIKAGALQSSLGKVHLPDGDVLEKEMKKLEGLIRASEILDCRLVRSFFFWQPHGEHRELGGQLAIRPDLMTEVLTRFAPFQKRAQEAGLIFGFENCGVTCEEVLAFLGAANVPEWGLAWDPYNDFQTIPPDQQAVKIIRYLQKSVMLHVKAASIVDGIVEAQVPWKRILRGLAASQKDIPVSVETHNPKNSPYTPEEASRKCFEAIRDIWPDAVPADMEKAVQEEQEGYPPCLFAENPVRYVVVGLGMGRFRAKQITENPSTRLIGVCDTNLEKAKAAGEELGVPYSDDIQVFLNSPDVEVMYIVTPTGLHCSVAEECLKAGKHVLTTKPMDADVESCDRAIQLAKEKGLLLGVDFDMRQTSEMMELVEAARRGWFGRILWADLTLYIKRDQTYYDENGAWRGTWRYDGGGAMSNQGIHEIDRLQEVLGIPDRVRAGTATQAHVIEAEDLGWSEWYYDNGCVARFAATTSFPIPAWSTRLQIHGTAGAYLYTGGGPEGNHTWWAKAGGKWEEKAPFPIKRRWRCGSDNFAFSVRTGEPSPISGEVGRKSRLILDSLYESAKNGGAAVTVRK